MPKKTKSKPVKQSDYHARIPAKLMPAVREMAEKGNRKVTQEITLAVTSHIEKRGK